jgi:hypothetical protein
MSDAQMRCPRTEGLPKQMFGSIEIRDNMLECVTENFPRYMIYTHYSVGWPGGTWLEICRRPAAGMAKCGSVSAVRAAKKFAG